MFPFFDLGTLHVSTYRFCYATAVLVGGLFAYARLHRLGIDGRLLDRGLVFTLGGIAVGLGMPSLVPSAAHYLETGAWSWQGQVRVVYGLATGIAVAWTYCRLARVPFGRVMDAGMLGFPLGYAVSRVGCFAVGCCHGKPTTSPLGMYLPDEYGVWMTRYPTQIMSSLMQLAIFVGLLLWERGRGRAGREAGYPFEGFAFLIYVFLFCLERFAVDWFREDSVPLWGPLSQTHLLTLAGMALAAAFMARNVARGRQHATAI